MRKLSFRNLSNLLRENWQSMLFSLLTCLRVGILSEKGSHYPRKLLALILNVIKKWRGLLFTFPGSKSMGLGAQGASLVAQLVQNPPAVQETLVWLLGREDPLEKGQAAHSCIPGLPWWLSWERIRLQCGRPGFNPWVGKMPWRRAWQPTPVFLPGESPWI